MTRETDTTMSSRATGLVGGILSDGEVLLKQGIALLRSELAQDLDSARQAVFLMAVGMAFGVAGLTLLCLMLAHLLSAYFAQLPLWVFFAAVGAPVALSGALMGYGGARALRTLNPQSNPVEATEE